MDYMEKLKEFIAKSKKTVEEDVVFFKDSVRESDEKTLRTEYAYPYVHYLGHLDILERISAKIETGSSKDEIRDFIEKEKVAAEYYVDECDSRYDEAEDIFDEKYFLATGIACELDEEYFMVFDFDSEEDMASGE